MYIYIQISVLFLFSISINHKFEEQNKKGEKIKIGITEKQVVSRHFYPRNFPWELDTL